MAIQTSILSASGRPIHVDFCNKNVTGAAAAPFIGNFTKNYPLFKLFCEALALFTGRNFNPLNAYSEHQLLITRVVLNMLGFSSLDDVAIARQDPLIRQTLGRLPSAATLCREEQKIGALSNKERKNRMKGRKPDEVPKYDQAAIGNSFFSLLNNFLLEDTLSRLKKKAQRDGKPPKFLHLDCDNTFIKTEGKQEGSAYCGKNRANGYYPLMCFLNWEPVHIQNAPAATDGRRLLEDCLEELIVKIRKEFPDTRLLIRADAGFNSQKIIDICEKHNVHYLIGFTGNAQTVYKALEQIRKRFEGPAIAYVRGVPSKIQKLVWKEDYILQLGIPDKPLEKPIALCGKLKGYKAADWSGKREIYYRIQINQQYDVDFRFVQTNIPSNLIDFYCKDKGTSKDYCKVEDCLEEENVARRAIDLYYGLYCERGSCELEIKHIKENKITTKLSAKDFFTNWWRLMLGALVQHIFYSLRESAFSQSNELAQWSRASFTRILKELFLLPATIKLNRRRLLLSVATIDENRRKAFEAIVNFSY